MVFEEDFFDSLPSDLSKACILICDRYIAWDESIPPSDDFYHYDEFLDAFAAIEAFVTNYKMEFIIPELDVANKEENIKTIREFYHTVKEESSRISSLNALEASRYKYKSKFGNTFSYQFSEGDIEKIQSLIDGLRFEIATSSLLGENHKQRLLARLEKLQKELHKKMSDLDKFWGLIGDAGVVIGKFGQDAKPFVDRIKEITDIVWRAQSVAEGLPSGTSMPMIETEKPEVKNV